MLTLQQNNAYLADGIVSFVSKLEINGQVVIQESQPLRAVEIAVFDRGNLSNDVTFEITTLHTGYAAALDFAARRRQTLGNLGDLVLNVPNEGYTATLPAAAWRTTGAKRDGRTSMVSYAVRGGLFVVSAGTGPIVFGLPVVPEREIDPLVIPSGTVADVPAGGVLCTYEIQIDGELQVDAGADVFLLTN